MHFEQRYNKGEQLNQFLVHFLDYREDTVISNEQFYLHKNLFQWNEGDECGHKEGVERGTNNVTHYDNRLLIQNISEEFKNASKQQK